MYTYIHTYICIYIYIYTYIYTYTYLYQRYYYTCELMLRHIRTYTIQYILLASRSDDENLSSNTSSSSADASPRLKRYLLSIIFNNLHIYSNCIQHQIELDSSKIYQPIAARLLISFINELVKHKLLL